MAGRSIDALRRLDKSAVFAAVGYMPHGGQKEVHASHAPRRVLACGVRWGKTTACAHEALCALLAPSGPSRGWVVSPTLETSALITRELFELLRIHFAHRVLSIDKRRRQAVVRNLAGHPAEVQAKSATRPSTLLGEALDWVILDEAARLKREIWEGHVSQRLTDRAGWALLASTPKEEDDWFHEQFRRAEHGDAGYRCWTRPTWDNPAIPRDVIDAEKERLDSRTFYTEYGGEFLGDGMRPCPTCGWGVEQWQRTLLYDEEWLGCAPCTDCERPIDANGEPVGMLMGDGRILLSVYGKTAMGPQINVHFDPSFQRSELPGS